MGYNPFDFLGTDKGRRIDRKSMMMAKSEIEEQKLREVIRKILKTDV